MFTQNTLAAYAAWTQLAEPLDLAANRLVSRVGPIEALELAVNGTADEVREASGLDTGVVAASMASWHQNASRCGNLLDLGRDLITASGRQGIHLVPAIGTALSGRIGPMPIALWANETGLATLEAVVDGDLTSLTVAGSRDATAYGQRATTELLDGLANYTDAPMIVTGGAYGIDATAQHAALQAGLRSATVLAGGLDRLDPTGNAELIESTRNSGGLISVSPIGTAPTRARSMARNKVLGALTSATLIVEARIRSSALHTARSAHTAQHPVGVVPGPINSTNSAGCHQLLKEAPEENLVITTAREIMDVLLDQ